MLVHNSPYASHNSEHATRINLVHMDRPNTHVGVVDEVSLGPVSASPHCVLRAAARHRDRSFITSKQIALVNMMDSG